jgi:hypothetical protein
VIQSLLGLTVDAAAGRVTMRPTLPKGVDFLQMKNLAVGGHRIDLEVRREDGVAKVNVTHAAPIAVIVEPPSREARFE